MAGPARPIVAQTDRHLKWRALDGLEHALMVACGVCLACFSASVFADVLLFSRTLLVITSGQRKLFQW